MEQKKWNWKQLKFVKRLFSAMLNKSILNLLRQHLPFISVCFFWFLSFLKQFADFLKWRKIQI